MIDKLRSGVKININTVIVVDMFKAKIQNKDRRIKIQKQEKR